MLLAPPSKEWSVVDPPPRAWLEVARQWLGDGPLWTATLGREREIAAATMVETAVRRGGVFLSGHPPAQARAAVVTSGLVLGGGGAEADVGALTAELCDIVNRLAPELAYACVSVEPSFASVVTDVELSDEKIHDDDGMYRPRSLVQQVCEDAVLDVYHHQVLGPAHVARLGRVSPGTVPLGGGRIGLTLGSAADWQPGSLRRALQRAVGRELLAPLLLGQRAMNALRPTPTADQLRELGDEPS